MSAEIANIDFEISVTQQGAMLPFGTMVLPLPKVTKDDLITNESTTCDAPSGKNIVTKEMKEKSAGMISSLSCKSPGYAGGTGSDAPITLGLLTISAGSLKVKCDSEPAHIKGDFGICSCSVTYTPPLPGTPVTVLGSCRFEITNAGQTKVKAK